MIDIFKSIDGQNDSAHFFLYKKLKINPVTVFVLFIVSMMSISLTKSIVSLSIWLFLIVAISLLNKSFKTFVIDPIISFKIFLIFSFIFSVISTYDITASYLFLFKVILLVLLSRLFNFFVNLKSLIDTLDRYFSSVYPVYIRTIVRKALFTLLLGIEFVSELFREAKTITLSGNNVSQTAKVSIIKKNSDLLISLLYLSFNKSQELEKYYTENGMNFINKREDEYKLFNYYDILIFLLMSLIIISIKFL